MSDDVLEKLHRRADAVRSRVTLSSVIGQDVKLVRAGNEHVGLCPFHHDTRGGNFSVNDKLGIYKCFACQAGGDHFKYLTARKGLRFVDALKLLEADCGIDFRDPVKRADYDREAARREKEAADDREKRRISAAGLWHHATPMQGTPAQLYLEARGIDFGVLGGFPGAIRYRHDCWNSEAKRKMPAMVTAMVALDAATPKQMLVAAHRTYLEYRRGQWVKAPLDNPKKTLGNFGGAHIALHKGACGRMPLRDVPAGTVPRISEGIEDGLTVAMADVSRRVIAAVSLDNLGAIDLPAQVTAIELIEQNDDDWRALRSRAAFAAGDAIAAEKHERAAEQIDAAKERNIARHQAAGRTVSRLWPEREFKDFNDQLRGQRMEGA